MGNVFERKDQTSLFCPHSLHYQHVLNIKVKVAKVMVASVLIVFGIWLMTFAF